MDNSGAPTAMCCVAKHSDTVPEGARPLSFADYFGIRHRHFRDQLADILVDVEERITIDRRAGELTIRLGGDTNQACDPCVTPNGRG
jgi:hypothetical protein